MRGRQRFTELFGLLVVIIGVALAQLLFSETIRPQFQLAMVTTAIAVSIHTFSGNSGVISFGNISFVAVGAFSAGLMSLGPVQKANIFPELFSVIQNNQIGNFWSLALATAVGAIFAAVVGIPLMRLNGLAAGIATLAVLGMTRNVLRNWTSIGPGAKTLPGVSETTGVVQATVGLVLAVVVGLAYQQSRFGRRLRATREDPAAAQSIGISIYSERLFAFVISGALGGFAGGLYVHYLGSITTEQVYLELTFLTLAMLVIGGLGSMWGAVLGGLLISGFSSFLVEAQKGVGVFGWEVQIPSGSRDIVLGILMVLVLLIRPDGLSKGYELQVGLRR